MTSSERGGGSSRASDARASVFQRPDRREAAGAGNEPGTPSRSETRVFIDTRALGEAYNAIVRGEVSPPMFDAPFACRLSPALTEREALLVRSAWVAARSQGDTE